MRISTDDRDRLLAVLHECLGLLTALTEGGRRTEVQLKAFEVDDRTVINAARLSNRICNLLELLDTRD